MSDRKLGMCLFIASDSATFGALVLSYIYLRAASSTWPDALRSWPSVAMASAMTAVLFASSVAMGFAVRAAKREGARRTVRYLCLAAAGGAAFLALHLTEWQSLIREGMTLSGNPWGMPLLGATFLTLTGAHMAHVAGGIIYLGFVGRRVSKCHSSSDEIETSALYWYFVDAVWMLIFPLVYLLPAAGR